MRNVETLDEGEKKRVMMPMDDEGAAHSVALAVSNAGLGSDGERQVCRRLPVKEGVLRRGCCSLPFSKNRPYVAGGVGAQPGAFWDFFFLR